MRQMHLFIERFKAWRRDHTPSWVRFVIFSVGGGTLFLGLLFNQGSPTAPMQSAELPSHLQEQAPALLAGNENQLARLSQAPHYTIQAWIHPDARTIEGQMKLVYTHRAAEPEQEVVVRLLPNAASIYGGGSLNVHTGLPSTLSEDGTTLYIRLPEPVQQNEQVEIELSFSALAPDQLHNGYGIFGQARDVLTLAGWYPILAPYQDGWTAPPVPQVGDALVAEMSFYTVDLFLPAGYQVASTGQVVEMEEIPEGERLRLVSGPAREFALAVSKEFSVLERDWNGVRLRLFTLPDRPGAVTAEEAMQEVEESFTAFTELYGPYPYTELDVVETVITIGGYEFTGMVVIDDELRQQSRRADYSYILVHEIAHQWWYGLAGNHSVDEPWLDEAFATYSAVLAYEHVRGPGAGDELLRTWQGSTAGQPGLAPVDSSAVDFSSWTPYRDAVYSQGALFLHELRQEMGDEAFFRLLRLYQEQHRYGLAEGQDFFALAETIHGQPLTELIEKWFK
jgi:hypothetical protein